MRSKNTLHADLLLACKGHYTPPGKGNDKGILQAVRVITAHHLHLTPDSGLINDSVLTRRLHQVIGIWQPEKVVDAAFTRDLLSLAVDDRDRFFEHLIGAISMMPGTAFGTPATRFPTVCSTMKQIVSDYFAEHPV